MYGVEGSSDAITRDMNSLLSSSTFKSDGEFAKIKELLISSNPYPNDDHHQQYSQNKNQNEKLSDGDAKGESSFFTNLLTGNVRRKPIDPTAASSSEESLSESDSRSYLHYSLLSTEMKEEAEENVIWKQDLEPPATYSGDSNHAGVNLECSSSFGNMNSRNYSNLMRQNSSPVLFLSSSSTVGNGSLSRLPSSSRFLPTIAENENDTNDTMFSNLKMSTNGELKMFSNQNDLETQNVNSGHHILSFNQHEDFLHFGQDSATCKIRAKRGSATHPRSIAERVRRTRISERIKKLQELFPNMEKQTNTADMLDMALEFIKDLQQQVQTLNDARDRCICLSKQLQSG